MKISLNWIKDFVNLKGINVGELLNKFTLSVAEIEDVEYKGGNLSGVISAQITSILPHPNSKKLHIVKIKTNTQENINVVCGAPNCKAGMKVAFATVGANVNGLIISKRIVAGIESHGMCCSEWELGIGNDSDGIIELAANCPLGLDIASIYGAKDVIFEIDNKSLTNRPDLWGHYGIAREIAAITDRKLKPLNIQKLTNYNNLRTIDIDISSDNVLRYSALTISNITAKHANAQIKTRLHYTGVRSINLLCDLTNYIMLELGQPMHAFDGNNVQNIQVYDVKKPTKFITLDGVSRTLEVGTTVIATNQNPIAIAGIMGGKESSTTNETNSVLIESANFNSTQIRKTSQQLSLRTESSARFEKTLDPNLTTIALQRYLHLLQQHDKNIEITSKICDVFTKPFKPVEIFLTKDYIDGYIGNSIPYDKIVKILTNLEFIVKKLKNGYKIIVPSHRATKDVKLPCDIVEEITRIYGYDKIVPTAPIQTISPTVQNKAADLEYRTKYLLATKFNLNEVHTYLWYDSQSLNQLNIQAPSVIQLVNALKKENSNLRQTIIPSLLKVVDDNKLSYSDINIFEIGKVASGLNSKNLVIEKLKLGIIKYSKTQTDEQLLNSVRELVLYLFEYELNLPVKLLPKQNQPHYYHPQNYYEIFANNVPVGEIALIFPSIKNKIMPNSSIVACEIDYDAVLALKPQQVKYKKISKYQQSEFDFSFVFPHDMLYSDIGLIASSVKHESLEYEVCFINNYQSDGNKVITIRYTIWSQTQTPTGEMLESFYNNVIKTFNNYNINLKTL